MSDQWTAPGAQSPGPPPEFPPDAAAPPAWSAPPGGFAPPGGPDYPQPGGFVPPVPQPYPPPGGFAPPGGPDYPQPGGFAPQAGVPAWRPAYDFRPGIIPLRPLQLGDLYGAVAKAVRGNVAATVGLAALTSAIVLVPLTAAGSVLAATDTTSLSTVGGPVGFGTFASWLPNLGTAISGILLAGFMAYVIGQAVLGRKVSLGETWAGTKGRVWRLIGATILIFLIVLGIVLVAVVPFIALFAGILATSSGGSDPGAGSVAGGVLGFLVLFVVLIAAILYVTTRLSFVTPAIVLEGQGVTGGIGRSWRLVGGARRQPFWRLLGIRLLTAMIVSVASSIITIPLVAVMMAVLFSTISQGGSASPLFLAQTIVTGLTGLLAGALTTPFTAGIDALLYVDTRMRREGLDVTLMRAVEGTVPPPWPQAVAP